MKRHGALVCCVLMGMAPVQAQDFYPTYIADGALTAAAFNAAQESVKQQIVRDHPEVVDQDPDLDTPFYRQISGKQLEDNVGYVVSLSVRERNLAQFIESSRRVDPTGAAKMEQVFATNDPIAAMEPELASMGMKINNVADAFAIYWINAWEAAHGVAPHPTSRRQAQAVSRQAAAGLAGTPAFQSATDAQKQELAEAMFLQALMIGGFMEETQSNPSLKSQVAQAVRQGAKAMGLDLDAARLTEDGFVTTGKRSEVDVAEPGIRPAQMAANAAAAPHHGDTVHPALWALGGAGALAAAYGAGKLMGRKG